ncbi:alpha/beta hydrolase [Nocardioides lianchengensis]|uniref:Alpha/beta hydrolase family protein n=1 Tax=Nocardioides lianchengensis TaxID=1045774 RepID=A0A1G6ZI32_9ACTN|nr:alpha/beta fold hydrolase [Nocardioides lianchengensis]NYG11395.1 alpha-beta hydrolase superfamily lysophospholipase [Nocardioides lianchengensis]SDE01455.1 Alpha/beta hydrolase family protein [Nocardioides lianchengensis]
MAEPRLVPVAEPRRPEGVVLVLHGGASRPGNPMVQPTQLSVLRMVPVARRIARATRGRVAVYRLLNSHRGWDAEHTPVMDAHWALGEIRERLGRRLPTCLVGHSLGGRAALLAGSEPDVVGVVALNPWVYPTDGADLRGRRVLVVHGDADRIASPQRAAAVAERLARTTEVEWRTVPGGKHAMLRHGSVFERAAAEFVSDALLPR